MIMSDEVKQALQTLRDNATNDFEHHRIDLLERDLTSPPKVEIIDAKHQRFLGVTYCKDKCGHYTAHLAIHRAVWSYRNGEIPEGWVIHHIDGDKANNDGDNLLCMSATEHNKLHNIAQPVDRRRICVVCGKPFEYKHKHNRTCSPECGKILSARTKKCQHVVERIISHCELCGKPIEHLPYEHPRFCSRKCVHKYTAQVNTKTEHVSPKEIRTCIVCGKPFEVTKSAAKQHCSPECRRQLNMKPCAICGKMFYSPNHNHKCCSRKCGDKLKSITWQKKCENK